MCGFEMIETRMWNDPESVRLHDFVGVKTSLCYSLLVQQCSKALMLWLHMPRSTSLQLLSFLLEMATKKTSSPSAGNQEAIVIRRKSFSDWRFWTFKWSPCSCWTGKVMTGGLEATIAPEIHNVAFCTSNSVHELLSCGFWRETSGKKKVLQKGVLRLLCLSFCLPSALLVL